MPIRGLLIDCYERSISPIFLPDHDVHLFYKEVNQALNCTTYIYATSVDGTCQIIADEDCLNKENIAFYSSFMSRPLFGNVILIGRDRATGNKVDLPDHIHELSVKVEFCSIEQTELYRQEALEHVKRLNKK